MPRLRLLLLLQKEELSVAELQEILGMGQSRISTHLAQLRQAGLVRDRRAGKNSYYALATNAGHADLAPIISASARELPEAERDRKALADVLHKVSLTETPRGPVGFDRYGNVVGHIFIRRCERKGGRLVNTTIKTYPNVSQFWTYNEKEFLANPVYARDYPPAKNLEP